MHLGRLIAAAAAAVLTTQAAQAEAVDFSGERITVIVPYSEGGGVSIYARFLASLMERHLPGQPSLVIRNVPGGGSMTGLNQFAREAGDDGLTIAVTGTSFYLRPLLGDDAVAFDPNAFVPLIANQNGWYLYLRAELEEDAGQIDDVQDRTLRYGGRSPTAGDLNSLLAFHLLDLDVNPIWGLSSGARRQAFMRGEVDIGTDSMSSFQTHVAPMLDDGTAAMWFSVGYLDEDGRLVRDPNLPDIPSFQEVYEAVHGQPPEGPAWEAYRALITMRVMSSLTLSLPADTRPEILQTYRDAMEQVVADPDYSSEEGRRILGTYPYRLGDEALAIMNAAVNVDPEVRDWLITWLEENHDVGL